MQEADEKKCSGCAKLERELADLRKQVAELTRKLEEKSRAQKRQAAPFRRSKNTGEKKTPGRKGGHQQESRPEPTTEQIDRTLEAPVDVCPQCQGTLEDVVTYVQFQTDIPPIQPTVTQINVQVGYCPCCQVRVQGTHPEQTSQSLGAAAHALGARAIAFAADLKYRLGMPFRKISDFLNTAFGLNCSASGLCRATQRLAHRSRDILECLKLQISGRGVVHADETGWWMNGDGRYLHVFGVDDIVIFQVGDRSHNVALDVLGAKFQGLVVCDGYVGYDIFRTARCNAHPIRRVRDLLESATCDQPTLQQIQTLLRDGLALRDRRAELTPTGYQRLATMHKHQFADWIKANQEHANDSVGRLARHLGKYEEEFLRYLDDPKIPATNNFAEGLLRFAVVLRKIGCCNRTERGVKTFEVLSSLLATFRRRGLDFADWVIDFLTGSGPKSVPPDLLPPGFQSKILLTS
jgi:transposase